jgi:hypothetical protein
MFSDMPDYSRHNGKTYDYTVCFIIRTDEWNGGFVPIPYDITKKIKAQSGNSKRSSDLDLGVYMGENE